VKVPLLHVIATDEVVAAQGFQPIAEELMGAGRDRVALHLRLRRTDGRSFHRLAERLGETAGDTGAWCVVNGRVDVALTSGARAVQLGAGALPVSAVRRIAGRRLAIGASVHSADEARARAREGADFLVAGAVFSTTTHPDRVPAGPALVTSCAGVGVPVLGIGGIDLNNAERVVAAGATGVAVIRAVWQAADPPGAALCLIDLVSRAGSLGAEAIRRDRETGSADA
jgi:thiamine-phosphate pyrophosphorylase